MKILILTQYFPPEVGAPQNRLYELAVRLQKRGADVTILTAMPNYPQMQVHENYKGKWSVREDMNGLKVHRSWIFVSKKKSIFFRLLNYYSFVFSSFWYGLFRIRRQDIILVESPPLFLGKTAWLLKLFKRSKLVFNVSDLWPESAERLGLVKNRLFLRAAYRLEGFLYKRSWLVTGQTQGIVNDIKTRFPKKKVFWLPNGVDVQFFIPDKARGAEWRKKNGFAEDDFILLYAGIIGYAQGLDIILEASQVLQHEKKIRFVLLGSGPEKERLVQRAKELKLSGILFLDAVSKAEMPAVLDASDVAVIPLRKLDIFKGAIPSKIFENLGMKKPVLLGVDGEARTLFIDSARAGLFFEPENHTDLAEKILYLYHHPEQCAEMGERGRTYVQENFERDLIAEKFWNVLHE